MIKLATFTLGLVMLTGCTQSPSEKALMNVYEKNKRAYHHLLKTEKAQFQSEHLTKALITATYLQNTSSKRSKERFIVGIYAEEVSPLSFSLKLDGKTPKQMKPLSQEDVLLKDLSFVSQWSQYYLVEFAHVKKKSFNMVVSHPSYGNKALHFAKVAKYVLEEK